MAHEKIRLVKPNLELKDQALAGFNRHFFCG